MSLFERIQPVGNFLRDRFSPKNVFEQEEEKKNSNRFLEGFSNNRQKSNPFIDKFTPEKKENQMSGIDLLKGTAEELPGQFKKTAIDPTVSMGQFSNRAYMGIGNWLANRMNLADGPYKPQTQFEKDLFGTEDEISFTSLGRETRGADPTKESKGVLRGIDPAVGFLIGALDLTPGGKTLKGPLKKALPLLSKLEKAEDIVSELNKSGVTLPPNAVAEISKTKSTSKIEKIIAGELQTQAKVAQEASKKRAPLLDSAKKFDSAEDFAYGTHEIPMSSIENVVPKEKIVSKLGKIESRNIDAPATVRIEDGKIKMLDGNQRYWQKADRGDKTIKIRFESPNTGAKNPAIELWNEAKGLPDTLVNKATGEEFKIIKATEKGAEIKNAKTGEAVKVDAEQLTKSFEPKPVTSQADNITGVQKKLESDEFAERALPKGGAASGNLDPKVQAKMSEMNYNTLTNESLLARAGKDVESNPSFMREQFLIADPKVSDAAYSNAVGIKLIEKYDNMAIAATDPKMKEQLYQQAADVWDALARRATSGGQSVQILSTISKQNPAVRRHFLNKTLDTLNDVLPPGTEKVKLTKADWDNIANFFAEADAANSNWMKGVKTQQATNYILDKFGDKIPAIVRGSIKLKKFRYMAMLLNPKTYIRNVLGNKTFAQQERVNSWFAAPVDKILSAKTGTRSIGVLDWSIYKRAAKEAKVKAREEIKLGVDTRMDKFKKDYPTTKFNSKIMQALDRWTQASVRVPDRVAFEGTFEAELASLMKINKVSEPTDVMIDIATYAGEYRTFQDASMLAQTFESFRKTVNRWGNEQILRNLGFDEKGAKYFGTQMLGAGDLVMPFVRTPFNLLARGLAYTPLGFARGMMQTKRLFSVANRLETLKAANPNNKRGILALEKEMMIIQRDAATALSRGAVGTGALVMPGYVLAKNGIISGDYDQSEAGAEGARRRLGMGPNRINLTALSRMMTGGSTEYQAGDVTASYDWLMPASIPVGVGVALAKMEDKGILGQFLQIPTASLKIIEDQPMLQTIKTLSGQGYGDGFAQGIADVFKEVPASFVPTFLNQVRQLTDQSKRQTKDDSLMKEMFINKIANRLPLLSKTLTPNIDAFGNVDTSMQNQEKNSFALNAFNAFINPAFISSITDKPEEIDFMLDLFNATGEQRQMPRYLMNRTKIKIIVNGEEVERKITPQERALMQSYVGLTTRAQTYELMQNPGFMRLDDVDKVEYLAQIANDTRNAAESIFLGKDVSKRSSKRVRSLVSEFETIKRRDQSYLENLYNRYDFRP